jgi:hypothetical protein
MARPSKSAYAAFRWKCSLERFTGNGSCCGCGELRGPVHGQEQEQKKKKKKVKHKDSDWQRNHLGREG